MPETLPKSELVPQVFVPSDALSRRAHISSFENYRKLHAESLADPETFWRRSALETLSWFHPVVGYPHAIKGQGIFAFVILNEGWKESPELLGELKNEVRHHIGPFATPDIVLIAPGLPKTRSGKIMRRILRNIAAGKTDEMGDLTTLADPSVVDALVARRAAKD